MCLAWFMQP